MAKAIMINERDNNATLFADAQAGEIVTVVRESGERVNELKARERIPVGHKIALQEIREGEKVVKYGETIGRTTRTIQPGEHVHVHNVVGLAFPGQPISSGSRGA